MDINLESILGGQIYKRLTDGLEEVPLDVETIYNLLYRGEVPADYQSDIMVDVCRACRKLNANQLSKFILATLPHYVSDDETYTVCALISNAYIVFYTGLRDYPECYLCGGISSTLKHIILHIQKEYELLKNMLDSTSYYEQLAVCA